MRGKASHPAHPEPVEGGSLSSRRLSKKEGRASTGSARTGVGGERTPPHPVTPAKAGVHILKGSEGMDSRLRGSDKVSATTRLRGGAARPIRR